MSSVSQLKPFLEPESIAVVGANPNSGEQAFNPSVKDIPGDKPIAWCPYNGWLFDIRSRDLADKLEEAGRAAVFSIPDDAVRGSVQARRLL